MQLLKRKTFLIILLPIIILCLFFIVHRADNKNNASDFESVSTATSNAQNVLGKKYQNIIIPNTVNVKPIEKAYIMSATRNNDDTDIKTQLEKLSIAYTGQKPDHVYLDEHNPNSIIGEINDKYHIEYSSSNSFHAYRLADWRLDEESNPSAVYNLSTDDISQVSYKVANQNYKLIDAKKLVEEFITKKLITFLTYDSELVLDRAYVFKSGDNYFYCFSGVHYIEGIPLSTVGTGSSDEPHMNGVDFRIYVDEPNTIGEIRNYRYPYITQKSENKQIISLSYALDYLEEYLAPYGKYTVSEITLEYCSKDNSDNGINYTYHPTWCFTITRYPTNAYQLEPKRMLYFDAMNKEVFCWDDTQCEFVFGDNIKHTDA